jgi:hypothetical protein
MTNDDAVPLVLFATYSAQPELTEDDQLFARALERRGVSVSAAAWDDPAEVWSHAAAVVIRSTWNYHLHYAAFLEWVDRVAGTTTLHNDARVVRWNSHKNYLADIAHHGVPVIDTVFVESGSSLALRDVTRAHEWSDIVVKPAVSASAHETRHFAVADRADAQAHLDRLVATRDVMVQPHLTALAEEGELSLLFARGEFTHAVRRRSALVDGHVMPKSAAADAPATALRTAERVLDAAGALSGVTPNELLYARVDLAGLGGNEYVLLELELIEPSLFLVHAPSAAELFADALLSSRA